ncbi:Pkinase domain-containing protein/B_lectin domain-containing protein [Cephalotus follicularis]|uniref:Pkinase domain-containing protein/B_lectin domain-containing protein n=1 Tax=Cephalotus follicularis TaxID=3775 RepID=A0A1Q3CG34_CEPFO|nr:Pkinase domain-containing protein/B_lectin domain-containing protein [Cephalotus follicularis]
MAKSVLVLILSLLQICALCSSTIDTLKVGSAISVEKSSDALASKNGVFSAGFHAVRVNAASFAIWFTKASDFDIVWMANRDKPVNGRGSKLSLLHTGNLILIDGSDGGQNPITLWAADIATSTSLHLQLLNTGNLVLLSNNGAWILGKKNIAANTVSADKSFDIAIKTARGLAYLHEESLEWVLQCDVIPQNILLDSNYNPKVADFGLSKLLNRGSIKDASFSRMRDNRGYMAPEWVFDLSFTPKVDVYSYGIVVLELITGYNPTGSQANINGRMIEHKRVVTWVRGKMKEATTRPKSLIEDIIDPRTRGACDIKKMEILVRVALQCVEQDKDARPTMSQVVEMLLQQKPYLP